MINKDRIVPVMKADLISLYYLMVKALNPGSTINIARSSTVEGDFTVASGMVVCDQPAKTIDVADGASAYFVPALDFEGFTVSGTATEYTGTIDPNGADLYFVVNEHGALTVTMITPAPVDAE